MKTLTSLLFILSFSLITMAQSNRDKIKTLKIAYITEKLNLTEKEAQQFWPIYNNFEDENSKLRKEEYELRKKNVDAISEEDARQLIKEHRLNQTKKNSLENEYINNLIKAISAKKVILLYKIEDDFKRKMFDEYKKRGRS
ncbi:hypothetical protein [Mariniflexile sp.]|uniref:hypothetical protein n=1 Tax=Mariniflexile sp. TaxID=1979402 RepID=UPI0035690100